MYYLSIVTDNYLCLGNNPFFHINGNDYPNNCNIKVPYCLVFNSLFIKKEKNENIQVGPFYLLYYAPFLKSYVAIDYYIYRNILPILKISEARAYTNKKITYNVNNNFSPYGTLFYTDLNINDTINKKYFSNSMLNNHNDEQYFTFPMYTVPKLIKEASETTSTILESYTLGYYIDNLEYDLKFNGSLKKISGSNKVYDITDKHVSWSFEGFKRSNAAIDVSPENIFDGEKLAGLYEHVEYINGEETKNNKSFYLGLSLYHASVDLKKCNFNFYMYVDVHSGSSSEIRSERIDDEFVTYRSIGKTTDSILKLYFIDYYKLEGNVFKIYKKSFAFNWDDELSIGGFWEAELSVDYNHGRIDEKEVINFTYKKTKENGADMNDCVLRYFGSTLDSSFLNLDSNIYMFEIKTLV